jgi:hypothetical protein
MHQLYESPPANADHYGKEAKNLTELEWFLADPKYFGTDDETVRSSVCEAGLVVGVQSGIRSPKWILRARSAAVQCITFFHLTSARISAR